MTPRPLDVAKAYGASEGGYYRLMTSLAVAVVAVLRDHGHETALALSVGDALSKLAADASGERPCAVCGAVKPTGEFYLAAGKPEAFCKVCRKAQVTAWRAANPERERQRKSSPRNRALAREYAKAHPEKSVEGMRRWRKRHPEEAKRQHRIAAQLRRNMRLRTAILTRDGCCLRCGATGDLTIDHIKPVLSGGDNDPGNLQTLCRRCNTRKRGVVDHRRKLGEITASVPLPSTANPWIHR